MSDDIEAEAERDALRARLDEATLQFRSSEALIASVISRIGGRVEGAPTQRINFLQRIHELIDVEREYISVEAEVERLRAELAQLRTCVPEHGLFDNDPSKPPCVRCGLPTDERRTPIFGVKGGGAAHIVCAYSLQRMENDALRAELAEAVGLLRDLREGLFAHHWFNECRPHAAGKNCGVVIDKAEALLARHAEAKP